MGHHTLIVMDIKSLHLIMFFIPQIAAMLELKGLRGAPLMCKSVLTKKLKQEDEPSTSLGVLSTKGRKRDSSSTKKEEDSKTSTPRKKIPVPPLPLELPPVNLLHRDTLRAWCQKLKVSSKGPKLEAYKRICQKAYPEQQKYLQNIPSTAKEARIKTIRQKTQNMGQENSYSEGTCSFEVQPVPEEQLAILQNPPNFYEEVSTTVVTTPAPESMLASWSRIASNVGNMEEVETEAPKETPGDRWCVVHGQSMPADTDGWVQLQFHAGQVWVPEKKGRVSALFLLPACTFPPPHLQDNMLCPKCVHRNKVLIKSLQ
ncbi:developmental pluripotency-associated protein 4 [Perognathus longimembris pacificus]|uniref:developmental pluripotency-associated protein 4 n=1 Tax=Perognathus longimembris pacificus TaxID=214514 RepID=UPI0020188D1B|nr:developmental pluripotency-associated protein 4 [Perognathus longimembris pacificus]